jgi:hypothetical protein
MNRPHALRVRTRLARTPKAAVAPEPVEAQIAATPVPAAAPIGGRRARGDQRSAPAKRTGYDDLTTEQVIAHISRLSPPELALLANHEREHQNRPEILARIAVFRGEAPES